MKDTHDPRQFDQYVSINADGTVLATHMILRGVTAPDGMVKVADLAPEVRRILIETHVLPADAEKN